MRRILVGTLLLTVITTATVMAVGGIFGFIKAVPQGGDILLQWKSVSEQGVQSYDIERNSEDITEFRRLGRITARGSGNTYSFVDDGAFFKPQSGKRFTYRIKAMGPSTVQYSPSASVLHDVSSIKRSLGMIKELFR